MTIGIYSYLKTKGSIMLPYNAVRALGIPKAVVTMELLAEFNYAQKNHLNYINCFLCDLARTCDILGMEWDILHKILIELEELNLFTYYSSDIKDITYIHVKQDKIIEYIEQNEVNNHFMNWDDGLKISLNPINKTPNFNKSTSEIKNYLDTHLKNPITIPLVLYSFLNSVVDEYEKYFGNIFKKIDVRDWLEDLVLKSHREDGKNASSEARYGFIAMAEAFNKKVLNYENGNNQE